MVTDFVSAQISCLHSVAIAFPRDEPNASNGWNSGSFLPRSARSAERRRLRLSGLFELCRYERLRSENFDVAVKP